ncbi:MAG: bifunctional UDP-N-acetylglucosamine diphosphorylase/glucosamine-1-phosphate N-acetyltransferase GlmU [Acidobacteriota bacterium]
MPKTTEPTSSTAPATPPASPDARRVAVVLAAGRGTRLRSATPKVLHAAAGRPLLGWVLDAARGAGCAHLYVVVGHGADDVRAAVGDADDVTFVVQAEQLGTGHALAQVAPHLRGGNAAPTLAFVLSGDVPGVTSATLGSLAEAAEADGSWGAMAVATLDEPGRLGRVLRADADDDALARIVEYADADDATRAVRRINAGIYALPAPQIFDDLDRLDTNNAQGEFYLTDALGLAVADGRRIALHNLADPGEAFGVNTRADLARVHRRLLDRHVAALMDAGVTVLEPARTTVEAGVVVGADTVIHPDVTLLGTTRIGAGCEIHQGAWIRDATLDDDVLIKPYSVIDRATVGARCTVGPFARLRPAAQLHEDVQIGNFVELKKTEMHPGSKASHLTYLGDATVGPRSNIGAGVITCNYDGARKHETHIGADAFIGSDTMLVAPVRVGDRATTGAGSVVNQDVADDDLAVARARQRNIPDWTTRRRRATAEPSD